jgi:hypothetical protein
MARECMGAPPLPRERAGGSGRWEGGERRQVSAGCTSLVVV